MIDDTQPSDEPAEPVWVTLELPAGSARAYDELVEDGIYANREGAFVHAIVEGWRHDRGTFHTVRLDVDLHYSLKDGEAETSLRDPGRAPAD